MQKYLIGECLKAWVLRCLECLSSWVPGVSVTKCLEWQSAKVLLQCSSAQAPNFLFSTIRLKKVWNIAKNGLAISFIEFLKTFQNTYFYKTLIVFSFFRNKMYKIHHILLARCNNSKEFQGLFLNRLHRFRKQNMMVPWAHFLTRL